MGDRLEGLRVHEISLKHLLASVHTTGLLTWIRYRAW